MHARTNNRIQSLFFFTQPKALSASIQWPSCDYAKILKRQLFSKTSTEESYALTTYMITHGGHAARPKTLSRDASRECANINLLGTCFHPIYARPTYDARSPRRSNFAEYQQIFTLFKICPSKPCTERQELTARKNSDKTRSIVNTLL